MKFILLLIFIISINADDINNVKICVDPDWMPMESIDKNGKHIGIIADILNSIEQNTNFNFTLIATKSWKQSLLFVKEKKCDVLPLVSKNKNREKWLNFTPPYIDYPEVLVTNANENKKTLEEILKLPLGLTKGYASIKWFKDKYPNANIVEVENIDDAFDKLRNKEIYSYSDTLSMVGYKIKQEGTLDLKISYKFDKAEYSLKAGMGVRKDKIKLYQDLTKAINNLNKNELGEILNKWVSIDIDDITIDYVFIFKILAVILFIVFIVLYWNYKLKVSVKEKTKEIKEFANTLENQVIEKTKEIRNLLDNAGQGFLTLNKNFLINNEYSKECEILLGANIANKDISTIIFNDIKKSKQFKINLNIILGVKNKNAQDSAITLLPQEVVINKKTLKIEYKIINDSFMLILTNISEKRKLEGKIKDEQNILKMTVTIIKDNDVFFDIKNDFEYFTNNISDYMDENKPTSFNINEIYRAIHTFKGSFLQLFMNNTASSLHEVESALYSILHSDKLTDNQQLLIFLKEIDFASFMNADLDNIIKVLGKSFLDRSKFILVKKKSLKTIENKCTSLIDKYEKSKLTDILEDIHTLSKKSLKSYLDPYARLSLQISHKIKKPIYEFEVIGDEDILLPETLKNFIHSLVHVFSNALVHGIEDPETRGNLGKNEIGAISCSFIRDENYLKIVISDDGSGINVEKIKEKEGNENLSDEEAYLHIFQNNFSTNDTANILSGRGIGLSAVKSELDILKGDIDIQSELGVGTKFIFSIAI